MHEFTFTSGAFQRCIRLPDALKEAICAVLSLKILSFVRLELVRDIPPSIVDWQSTVCELELNHVREVELSTSRRSH